jgi:TfoX/Sxy family transcriptional regulator of competence genes
MATKQETVDFICEQSGLSERVTSRKMFGEFALYVDGKVIGLVCDDILYVKPTLPGPAILGTTVNRPPYNGAIPHFCITDQLENRELLQQLFLATAAALPAAKPKATTKRPTAPLPPRKTK